MRQLIAVLVLAVSAFATGFAQEPAGPPQEPAAPPVRKLQIAFSGSNVTLIAQNVSLPEILSEWQRRSGCVIVNADRLSRAQITIPIVFENQPQKKVLEALLRPAAGFFLSPRTEGRPGATDFELVYILATSSPTPSGYGGVGTYQAPIATVESPEIPPIPAPPPQQQQPPAPAANQPGSAPGVFITPIPAATTPTIPGRGGTPPPPVGRGGGGFY
jgi:hypothetical protein